MINRMLLTGRLTRDVEMRRTQSDMAVANFTVAWSEKYKERETQLFLDCTAWGRAAENIFKYFVKGKPITVEGKLQTDKWQDDNGNTRTKIKMTVEQFHFWGTKTDADDAISGAPISQPSPTFSGFDDIDVDDEDLPF